MIFASLARAHEHVSVQNVRDFPQTELDSEINAPFFLRTFAPKSSHAQIFFKLATQKDYDILLPKRQKKLGVTDFVLERTCLEKYPKSEKSGFVS